MIKENFDITGLTTFGLPVKARYFAEYTSVKELIRISRSREYLESEVLHIGGGSNLLFTGDFDGMVLHSAVKGIMRYEKDADHVFVIAGAGEKWTDLVDWCVAEGLAGLENLAGIPGEVGASPVQNVGAYGVEVKDVLHAVECFDTETRETVRFTAEECRFGYRDSRFKHEDKGRYYVLRVSFRLKPSTEASNLEYGPLKDLAARLGHTPTIQDVKREVEQLRARKLPDPKETGSAGSFFKNPVIDRFYFENVVLRESPDCVYYPHGDSEVKLSAAWLIDHAGLKGHRVGGAEVWRSQPLVIANAGGATAKDVCRLASEVQNTVFGRFGVWLHPEVNYIDSTIKVTVLGSGTSKGVPEIGCGCHVCRSDDARDKRFRSSVIVSTRGVNILIDASPDFRMQALANGIREIDAVLVTHSHTDHVGGLDDLRPFCGAGNIPLYLKEDVASDLRRRYDYCFREQLYPGAPKFDIVEIDSHEHFTVDGVKVVPVGVNHGKLPILGFRIGDFAYITDAKTITDSELEKLQGVRVLIINGLRYIDHFAHLTIPEACEVIRRVAPHYAFITHLSHEAGSHEELTIDLEDRTVDVRREILPDGSVFMRDFPKAILPAFDGMKIEIDSDSVTIE